MLFENFQFKKIGIPVLINLIIFINLLNKREPTPSSLEAYRKS